MKSSLLLICLLTVSFTSAMFEPVNEIETDCLSCTTSGWGYRYFKCLYPISPKEYFCTNNSRTIPFGSIILEVVYNPSSCQDITFRLPSRNISDINDLSGSFSVDDIFIIFGNTTGWTQPITSYDNWIFIPCIVLLALAMVMQNETIKKLCKRRRAAFRLQNDVESVPIE